MKETLKLIGKLSKEFKISTNKSVYLLHVHSNLKPGNLIDSDEMLYLVQEDLVGVKGVSDRVKAIISHVPKSRVPTKSVKFNDETFEIVEKLAKAVTPSGITPEEYEKYKRHNAREDLIPYMHIMLKMFPTTDIKKNQEWITHFKTPWEGVTLRKLTKGFVRKFTDFANKYDMGLLLYGVYKSIEQSYSKKGGRYYIKSMDNFIKEWENWYEVAHEEYIHGNLDELTDKTIMADNKNTYIPS